jgi:hypothetical protein
LFGLLVLSSGTLLQTSCSALAQDAIIGLGSAIANSFIQNIIYQALNVSGFSVGT